MGSERPLDTRISRGVNALRPFVIISGLSLVTGHNHSPWELRCPLFIHREWLWNVHPSNEVFRNHKPRDCYLVLTSRLKVMVITCDLTTNPSIEPLSKNLVRPSQGAGLFAKYAYNLCNFLLSSHLNKMRG